MAQIKPIKKVLVANRGEIAIRIFRACTELGIRTVALYTHEDRFSLHRYKADEAYEIGTPGNPVASYLAIDDIVALALRCGVDAIHPGYGFLSERADFRTAVVRAGLRFIGPSTETLTIAGDKVKTLTLARKLRIPTIAGSKKLTRLTEAKKFAKQHGYPLILKASFGGGGRGMRVVRKAEELENAFHAASEEARAAFGKADIYLEKYLERPKHIEVQLLGDGTGDVLHLYERDCSVQRRHQKVVEVAPSLALSTSQKKELYTHALSLGRALQLLGVATVEFLVANNGTISFIEINPRIQVEHTVTEEITGIDLIQTQIKIAEGHTLTSLSLSQKAISPHGFAIQCRVTTEDPTKGFTPHTGKLVAYRSASGFGIRLDAGSAFTGAVITPYYDSLLVKVTARGQTLTDAARKLRRCLSEFRVRGVATNIPFLDKVLSSAVFLKGEATTTFIDDTPELLTFSPRKDRANKILRFLGEVAVNGHRSMNGISRPSSWRTAPIGELPQKTPPPGWRTLLLKEGKQRLLERVYDSPSLLITDTTLRDAHQSLLATRVRTQDMLTIAAPLAHAAPELFSLEMWGGATYDVSLRFLHEDPWERLSLLREKIPNILFQMLVRGANLVGYKNYPRNVIRAFIEESLRTGIDIVRVFDCFNSLEAMRTTIDTTREFGGIVEGCICYTGDLIAESRKPKRTRCYDLPYYLTLAREIAHAGADILAIKDMAGLLRPSAATTLIQALRQEIGIPIHLHTHDTAGGQIATYLAAAEAGVHIVDCAISSMSGVTSQPSLEGMIAASQDTPRATDLSIEKLIPIADYWEGVRSWYAPFESDLRAPTGEVYLTEIPGGQYSNLRPQAESVGLGERWSEVKKAYQEANLVLGNIIKVTPSSKVVGDLALFMVSHHLTGESLLAQLDTLDLPDSVIELCKGEIGLPHRGLPKIFQKKVLTRAGLSLPSSTFSLPDDLDMEKLHEEFRTLYGYVPTTHEFLSFLLYPKVWKEHLSFRKEFGELSTLPTLEFLYGPVPGKEITVDIEPGKRLFISLTTITTANEQGEKTVLFELNGQGRSIVVRDLRVKSSTVVHQKADVGDRTHIAAPLGGALVAFHAKVGETVKKDAPLCTVEAMKMQSVVRAPFEGVLSQIVIRPGTSVASGDLLCILKALA